MSAAFAQRLRDAAAALPNGPVSLQALAQAHGPAAQGSLMLLLAAPCLLPVPGLGTLLGVGMLALAMAMWRGDVTDCLPRRVAELELSQHWAQRVLRLLAAIHALAGRFAKARLSHLAAEGRCLWLAATTGLMAAIIVLPIPFGNLLPALAMALIGIGLVFRDGIAVLLGFATAGLALLLTVAMVSAAWVWIDDWAMPWLAA